MKLHFVSHVIRNGYSTAPGDEIEVEDIELAKEWLLLGFAFPVKEQREAAVVKPAETTVARGSRIKEV